MRDKEKEGLTTWQTKTIPRIKALEPMTTEDRKPMMIEKLDRGWWLGDRDTV